MSSIQAPVIGALYASRESDGRYRIVKVLALDDSAVHVRIYADRFQEPPASISSADLSIGFKNESEFGVGHLPLNRRGAGVGWVLVGLETVDEDELDGYRIWAGLDPI